MEPPEVIPEVVQYKRLRFANKPCTTDGNIVPCKPDCSLFQRSISEMPARMLQHAAAFKRSFSEGEFENEDEGKRTRMERGESYGSMVSKADNNSLALGDVVVILTHWPLGDFNKILDK